MSSDAWQWVYLILLFVVCAGIGYCLADIIECVVEVRNQNK